MRTIVYSLMIALAILSTATLAHQPQLVFDTAHSESNPIIVSQPEISKAYYGELRGQPEYYTITSDKSFLLYVNILSPKIPGSKTDYSVEIMNPTLSTILDAGAITWKEFYEPYGKDYYWMGPEYEKNVDAGTYLIKVHNPDNKGKYTLAVGKAESFGPLQIIKTIFLMPKLKSEFFEESAIWSNILRAVTIIAIVLILALIIFGAWKGITLIRERD